jgi:hypothetical protein
VTISGPADAAVAATPLRNVRRRMTDLHGREEAPSHLDGGRNSIAGFADIAPLRKLESETA